MTDKRRGLLRDVAAYVAASLGALMAATFALGLLKADLRIPFSYGGDALATSAQVKNLIEHGTLSANPMLGAPSPTSFLDYPGADGVHVAILRVIASLTHSYGLAMNLFYLLGFVLVAVTTVAALRALRVSRTSAVAVAILYSALPYHFQRGEVHFFLSAYWMIPLAVLVCVWLGRDEPLVFAEGSWRLLLRARRTLAALAICLVLGESGIYYAFFTAFLLAVVGVYAAVRKWQLKPAFASAVLILAVCLSLAAGLAPSVLQRAREGANPAAAQRWVGETEIYALRIPQLVLPVTDHRIAALAIVKAKYHETLKQLSPLFDNENDSSSLGLVFTAGFMGLLAIAVWPRRREQPSDVGTLAVMNIGSVLLATVSGFNLLVAMLISPQLRAYNRISVFIAFPAAAAVAIALDRLRARLGTSRPAIVAFVIACVLLVSLGVYDQSSLGYLVPHEIIKQQYDADGAFVAKVEAQLPRDAMVFQLPYMPYPESPPVEQLADYQHLRAYLHSTKTRWSYGAIKGREIDRWQAEVAAMPAPRFLSEIESVGFDGVWIDKRGYADSGSAIIDQIESLSGGAPITSEDGNVVFIPLAGQ